MVSSKLLLVAMGVRLVRSCCGGESGGELEWRVNLKSGDILTEAISVTVRMLCDQLEIFSLI